MVLVRLHHVWSLENIKRYPLSSTGLTILILRNFIFINFFFFSLKWKRFGRGSESQVSLIVIDNQGTTARGEWVTACIYYLKTRGQGCNLIVYFYVKIKISFMEGTLEGVTVVDINTQLVADALSVVTVKKPRFDSVLNVRCTIFSAVS